MLKVLLFSVNLLMHKIIGVGIPLFIIAFFNLIIIILLLSIAHLGMSEGRHCHHPEVPPAVYGRQGSAGSEALNQDNNTF